MCEFLPSSDDLCALFPSSSAFHMILPSPSSSALHILPLSGLSPVVHNSIKLCDAHSQRLACRLFPSVCCGDHVASNPHQNAHGVQRAESCTLHLHLQCNANDREARGAACTVARLGAHSADKCTIFSAVLHVLPAAQEGLGGGRAATGGVVHGDAQRGCFCCKHQARLAACVNDNCLCTTTATFSTHAVIHLITQRCDNMTDWNHCSST